MNKFIKKLSNYLIVCYLSIPIIGLAEGKLSSKFTKCMDKVTSTADSINCIGTENKAQDKRLNVAYQKLIRIESANRQKELQSLQKLWLKYQKANCDFYYNSDDGTIMQQMSASCWLESTKDRANELEFLIALKK